VGGMSESAKVGIIAAMEREIRPLVRSWRVKYELYEGREYKLFERGQAVAICGGIGSESARRTTEALVALRRPRALVSVGFAGALNPELQVGQVISPRRVIDMSDGSATNTMAAEAQHGILLSTPSIAGAVQKAKLRAAYSADAVDMEAAAVARVATSRGLPFIAIKAISDDAAFDMPEMDQFVVKGQFQSARFAFHVASHPQIWGRALQLAKNSNVASNALCAELKRLLGEGFAIDSTPIERTLETATR
jgi:adenosylhomocysteine nucleosidase